MTDGRTDCYPYLEEDVGDALEVGERRLLDALDVVPGEDDRVQDGHVSERQRPNRFQPVAEQHDVGDDGQLMEGVRLHGLDLVVGQHDAVQSRVDGAAEETRRQRLQLVALQVAVDERGHPLERRRGEVLETVVVHLEPLDLPHPLEDFHGGEMKRPDLQDLQSGPDRLEHPRIQLQEVVVGQPDLSQLRRPPESLRRHVLQFVVGEVQGRQGLAPHGEVVLPDAGDGIVL